jgi:S1-C subfamily serine protease
MQRHSLRTVLITALLASAATIVALKWDLLPGYGKRELSSAPIFAADPPKAPELTPDEQTNVQVYDKVSPGVVNITKQVLEFDFFYAPVYREGSGSGCVLDLKGHILTNYHVIESAKTLEVTLSDQSQYGAELVGFDEQNDLAVIRIKDAPLEKLHPIELGNSDTIRVGQKVLAIGNPLGLQNTLTVGIISSLNRRIQTENGDLVDNVIQTDAAINPGNSGGPLLNTDGDMIGINTSIFTIRGGGNIGIGFAIPSNTIRRVVSDLLEYGKVLRPWFGVKGYAIDQPPFVYLDLPVKKGFLITRIDRGSPADKARFRGPSEIQILGNWRIPAGGDIITEIDGQQIASEEELRLALEMKRPGDTIHVVFYRDGAKMDKDVVLQGPQDRNPLRF